MQRILGEWSGYVNADPDSEYQKDFDDLDREGDAIVLNEKFSNFMRKHFGPLTKEEVRSRNARTLLALNTKDLGQTVNYSEPRFLNDITT